MPLRSLEVTPEKQFKDYIVNPEALYATDFVIEGRRPWQEIVFEILQNTWRGNGYIVGKKPRHEVMVIEGDQGLPFTVLRSVYNGLDDEGLVQRQQNLTTYNQAWLDYVGKRETKNGERRKVQLELFEKYVGLEYSSGLQGVETFCLTFASEYEAAERAALSRLSISMTSIAVWRTYQLPEERAQYDTPSIVGGYPLPNHRSEEFYVATTGHLL